MVGAAILDVGDVLVLERRFTWMGEFSARIVSVRGNHIRAEAVLRGSGLETIDPPLTAGNFEGMAVHPGICAYIYLISDDAL